ncbi:MAG: HAD-IIIA family hydrolase [Deltaproteobacteria bacterium]|nr:HAD-IIIA family hydrolase [Deltaproteobacteria bacterium]MCZ6908014.1 HAD-IIIA family hydrolase [Deltaproteobacteria bacterium]
MKRIPAKIRRKAQRIKLLLLDVDGVLSDGRIVVDNEGEEIKYFDARDGHGIRLLARAGIEVGLLTGRYSRVVSHRARDLGIRMVYQKVFNKVDVYQKIKRRKRLTDQEVAYVGDDIVDLPVLRRVGLSIAVRDAWEGLKNKVDYVTEQKGGRGAVREVVEMLLHAQGKWGEVTKSYYD